MLNKIGIEKARCWKQDCAIIGDFDIGSSPVRKGIVRVFVLLIAEEDTKENKEH